MDDKLSQILKNKTKEVRDKKERRDFLGSIKNPKAGDISIIAEIKLTSPTEGKLGEEENIVDRAILYGKSPADAISVVVDNKYFGGKLEFIKQIKEVVVLPILAKDFIIDLYQIYEAKVYGTDAILLMAKIVSPDKLNQLVKLAMTLNIEPVVEVQNEQELENATKTNTQIIAVNARDLNTFEIDVDEACRLLKVIPQKFVTLGFSGAFGRNEVEKYRRAGAKGVLVGTSLMKAQNIAKFIKELKGL